MLEMNWDDIVSTPPLSMTTSVSAATAVKTTSYEIGLLFLTYIVTVINSNQSRNLTASAATFISMQPHTPKLTNQLTT